MGPNMQVFTKWQPCHETEREFRLWRLQLVDFFKFINTPFLLTVAWYVLLPFTTSPYPFGIFKAFLRIAIMHFFKFVYLQLNPQKMSTPRKIVISISYIFVLAKNIAKYIVTPYH
jgi:hypothetical protein